FSSSPTLFVTFSVKPRIPSSGFMTTSPSVEAASVVQLPMELRPTLILHPVSVTATLFMPFRVHVPLELTPSHVIASVSPSVSSVTRVSAASPPVKAPLNNGFSAFHHSWLPFSTFSVQAPSLYFPASASVLKHRPTVIFPSGAHRYLVAEVSAVVARSVF